MVYKRRTRTLIFDKCEVRDTLIWAAAQTEINENLAIAPPEMHSMIGLKIHLEVLTILYEEYRYVYFTLKLNFRTNNYLGMRISPS